MVVILMGVSGAGKTTVGQLLARTLRWAFLDADSLHPDRNKDKMARGIPLSDADRRPWLRAVREWVHRFLSEGHNAVIACSALKQSYREEIVVDPARVKIVYLHGSQALITQRLQARTGHFMPSELLRSQFDALEEPQDAIVVDVSGTPEEITGLIRKRLGL